MECDMETCSAVVAVDGGVNGMGAHKRRHSKDAGNMAFWS